jgi:nitrate/TMAO reductase-like tetraheme cytochrome c subunit
MAIATAMAIVFIILLILELAGFLVNPYVGLVIFVAVPTIFIIGLLLIPIGVRRSARRRRLHPEVDEWPVIDLRNPRLRRTLAIVLVLTIVNVVIVSLAAYGGIHYMESTEFCGQVCHITMEPQAVAHTAFTHSAVACTQCHVGPGAGAFVESKLAGARQLWHVAAGSVPKPVLPPADLIQSSAVTCTQCHSAATRSGDRLRELRSYSNDEANTETVTALRLKVGDPSAGIHRHIGLDIEYVATDSTRATIPVVRVRDAKGVREFVAEGAAPDTAATGATRRMECTDCHNRPAHTFSFSPDRAVDRAMAAGTIPRDLPFVRREAVTAVTAEAESREAGLAAIERHLTAFYASQKGANPAAVQRAIEGAQQAWVTNVFPAMNVKWGTYPNHLGHTDSPGCFRCHDDGHKAADGSVIKQECELCHTFP